MVRLNTVEIDPPLLNSSCAWSSDLQQLSDLYDSPYTGAITTRTATLNGFKEDDSHTVAFASESLTSINSYGYSPHPLHDYIHWTENILTRRPTSQKPIIISITASEAATLRSMVQSIQTLRQTAPTLGSRIAIEVNTSCPNIRNSPPSGYSFGSLLPLLGVLRDAFGEDRSLTIGLKLPPYVSAGQFSEVYAGLKDLVIVDKDESEGAERHSSPISFLSCTNTLGNSLLFNPISEVQDASTGSSPSFALPTTLGGLGGESIHPLALGNVFNFKRLLNSVEAKETGLGSIKIIGIGGVTSKAAVIRMKTAGADIVGCATLFGKEGVRAFEMLGK